MTADALTMADALNGYMLDLRSRNVSHHTLSRYGRVLRRFSDYLSERGVGTVHELKVQHAQAFLLKRLGEVADVSAHFEATPIKSWGSWLEAEEFVRDNPFRRVKKPKMAQRTPTLLTTAEVKALLASYDRRQPDQHRDLVMVSLVLATGLRRSEVCDAKLSDLADDHRSLLVTGKGRRQRRVPISSDVSALIWRYVVTTRKRYAGPERAWLFVNRRGAPIDPVVWTHRFSRQVRAAGIEKRCTIHNLRHLAATTLLERGMPLELVSRTLGHATSTVTSAVYAHVGFAAIQSAYDAVTLRPV